MLRMLPVCIGSYPKSVLRYKCLILYTYHHPYTQYLREQGCEDPWLFVEAKRGSASKNVGEHYNIVYSIDKNTVKKD